MTYDNDKRFLTDKELELLEIQLEPFLGECKAMTVVEFFAAKQFTETDIDDLLMKVWDGDFQ